MGLVRGEILSGNIHTPDTLVTINDSAVMLSVCNPSQQTFTLSPSHTFHFEPIDYTYKVMDIHDVTVPRDKLKQTDGVGADGTQTTLRLHHSGHHSSSHIAKCIWCVSCLQYP